MIRHSRSIRGSLGAAAALAASLSFATPSHAAVHYLYELMDDGGPTSTSFHYFANGAFGNVGIYAATVLRGDTPRLTVTQDAPLSGAPERAEWALIFAGFGLAGTAIRARRRRLQVSA